MKKILYVIVTILMLAGCADDLDPITSGDDTAARGDYKISAYTDTQTKVDIDGTSIKWAENDYIYIAEMGENGTFNQIHYFSIDNESISEDGKYADFYGDVLEEGKEYFALVAPWSHVVEDSEFTQSYGISGSLFVGTWDQSQSKDGNDSHVEASWYMTTPTFEIESNDTPIIGFNNISSYLDLTISMEEDVTEKYEITKISFTAPTQMFRSQFYQNTNREIIYSVTTNTLNLTLNDEFTSSSTNDYTAYIPFIPNDDITQAEGNFT